MQTDALFIAHIVPTNNATPASCMHCRARRENGMPPVNLPVPSCRYCNTYVSVLEYRHVGTPVPIIQHKIRYWPSFAKLSSTDVIGTISCANNSIEIVEHSFSFNLPITFHSNYFHFGNSSLFCEFPLLINIFKVLAYCRYVHIEKHPHCLLCTPHCFIFVEHFNTLFLPFNLKDKELSRAISYFFAICHNTLYSQ